jgi:competence protein ComEC
MVLWRGRGGRPRSGPAGLPWPAVIALSAAVLVATAALFWPHDKPEAASPNRLVVRVLDVGQGDAILLDPPSGDPVLVDAGPAGAEVEERLRELGVESLAAVVISHDQADHAAEGGELDSGSLRLAALWPPPELARDPSADPNAFGLVLLAEWGHFSVLLSGDVEAEAAPIDPGPIDVLKVAHHGSEDAGLDGLLEHSVPKLAVISVGEDNPYGHPAPETVGLLNRHGVRSLGTDQAGEVVIEASASGWTVAPEKGG